MGRTRTLKAKKGLTGRHVITSLRTSFSGVDLSELFDVLTIALGNSSQRPVTATITLKGIRQPITGQLTKGDRQDTLTLTIGQDNTARLSVEGNTVVGTFG